jgi:hypothetical protein
VPRAADVLLGGRRELRPRFIDDLLFIHRR